MFHGLYFNILSCAGAVPPHGRDLWGTANISVKLGSKFSGQTVESSKSRSFMSLAFSTHLAGDEQR